MKAGSGHKTPRPTIPDKAAPIIIDDFIVDEKMSLVLTSAGFTSAGFY